MGREIDSLTNGSHLYGETKKWAFSREEWLEIWQQIIEMERVERILFKMLC